MSTDFRTGNSGNKLQHAVVKIGDGCQQEGSFCEFLGPNVTPEIYAILPNGYVMESLIPATWNNELLVQIEALLEKEVWSRPPLPISNDASWQDALLKFGVKVTCPTCVIQTDPCLVHGDPTASNALARYRGDNLWQLLIADPRPPRDFIPQNRETDMGRILQSYMGWEFVAYDMPRIQFVRPSFMHDHKLMKAAKFWCGAAAARIEYLERSRENRPRILDWCNYVRKEFNV